MVSSVKAFNHTTGANASVVVIFFRWLELSGCWILSYTINVVEFSCSSLGKRCPSEFATVHCQLQSLTSLLCISKIRCSIGIDMLKIILHIANCYCLLCTPNLSTIRCGTSVLRVISTPAITTPPPENTEDNI